MYVLLQKVALSPHKLTPEVEDSFWVNLIGKGYPAPRQKFRWCTDRLKIRPSNKFIRDVVRQNGEAILLLGTRKAESQRQALSMARHQARRVRDRLRPNANLPNSLVYTPIEDWSNDDVWLYLMQVKNPWGHDNKTLLGMYQGASEGGECPLVIDTSTPSCGSETITESFRFRLRKRTLVERILIDPTAFAVTLYDATGTVLPRHRLSEGEKQIFAISILWGLARASSRPLPAVIDTPMARLDATHRLHLVDRYFPKASHQVVILSTDTEVDKNYYERLRPNMARAYHLDYDEKERVTVGREGYFWTD